MTDRLPANGYTDGDVDTNPTTERSLESMAAERYSRRQALFRGAGATTMAFMGTALLAACGDDDNENSVSVSAGANAATSAGRVVTLTGSPENGYAGYSTAWAQTSGTTVELTGSGSTVSFIAPAVSAATDLVFTFSATSVTGETRAATTTVRV